MNEEALSKRGTDISEAVDDEDVESRRVKSFGGAVTFNDVAEEEDEEVESKRCISFGAKWTEGAEDEDEVVVSWRVRSGWGV